MTEHLLDRLPDAAANQNEYKESVRAYGSKTRRKGGSAKAPKPVPVSVDYVAK